MQKQSMNVMIFDDDEEPGRQQEIKRYTSTNRNGKQSSLNGHSSEKGFKKNVDNNENKMPNLLRQMQELQQKIKVIQRQGQRLRTQMQKKGNNGIMNTNKTNKQIQQILMIIQKKVQVIIQQSKKLINKVSQTVQRRLSAIQIQKLGKNDINQQSNKFNINATNSEINEKLKNRLTQIQLITKQKLEYYEHYYQTQYEKLAKQTKRKQQNAMKKLSEMELKFTNKLNAFQTKQKQYIDWIHHLEAKLKDRKSKKMITITQQKPQISPISSKNPGSFVQNTTQLQNQQQLSSNRENNLSSINFQTSRANMSISDQNNSKIIRKHKIFGGNSVQDANKSVSPLQKNQQKQSPKKDSIVPQKGPTDLQNQQSSGSSFYQQPSINDNGNLNFYSELRRSQAQKPYHQVRQQQQTQYKFADLNQFSEEYNESESDDFFAPIEQQDVNGNYERVLASIPLDSRGGTYYRQNVGQYGYENYNHQNEQHTYQNNINTNNNNVGQKVFSPFDLN